MSAFSDAQQAAVPLMIGYNSDEGTLINDLMNPAGAEFAPPPLPGTEASVTSPIPTPQALRSTLERSYPSPQHVDRLLAAYPGLELTHFLQEKPLDILAAMLERANHADALVSPNGEQLSDLPQGALIGSSSLRRQAQLKMLRPDLRVEPLRGNVNTRLAKLDNGDYDAIILAAAGLERLGFDDRISQLFVPDQMLPAAAQGVVGIECLEEATELRAILAQLNHPTSVQTTLAERAIARVLEASCQSPVATYAVVEGDALTVSALVAMPDGSESIRDSVSGDVSNAEALGEKLAARLLERGAAALLEAAGGGAHG